MQNNRKAAVFDRQSELYSTSAHYQRQGGLSYCSELGIPVAMQIGFQESAFINIYRFDGGGKPRNERSTFHLELNKAKANGVTDLVFRRVDRFSRSTLDFQIAHELVQSGLSLHFYEQDFTLDKGSKAWAWSRFRELLNIAETESQQKSYIAQVAGVTKLERGEIPFHVPWPYYRRNKKLFLDPAGAVQARRIAQLILSSGYSALAAMRESPLTRPNGKPVIKRSLYDLLRSEFVTGRFTCYGQNWVGDYESLWTPADRKLLISALEGKSSGRVMKHNHPNFCLTCGHCGCSFVAEVQKGILYYHCSGKKDPRCPQKRGKRSGGIGYIPLDRLIGLLTPELNRIDLPSWVREKALELLHEVQAEHKKVRASQSQGLRDQESQIKRRLTILEDRYDDGEMPRSEYLKRRERHREALRDVQDQLSRIEVEELLFPGLPFFRFELHKALMDAWEKADPHEKAKLFKTLSSNCVMLNGKPHVHFKEPFDTVEELAVCEDWSG